MYDSYFTNWCDFNFILEYLCHRNDFLVNFPHTIHIIYYPEYSLRYIGQYRAFDTNRFLKTKLIQENILIHYEVSLK